MRGFLDEDEADDRAKGRGGRMPVEVTLHLHHETDRAWLVSETGAGGDATWLAKSAAERGSGRDEFTWTLPEWLATARGWL